MMISSVSFTLPLAGQNGIFSASSTTQETGGMQGDFSEKSTVTDMKDTTDEMNWNLMLENNKSAIPENYGSN